ncbi:type IV pilus modification PilV family protein [Stenotrophomonas mori]|uniref:Prepilin-type cleavage/methylation domain-containing protein n=1 Tax=Stenotrophomonas mori TaxID=2871096 RepID=A0ABT0SGQ9_9GAMM|nr:hypothetical protein [Stenotrophomonas mori]MCL7714511.1 hypothetical protein [Stenotrophomonas mori]
MSTCFERPRGQRGDMMLEALVAVLITSVIGAGLAHVAAKVMSSQHDAKVENLAVERLRSELHSHGVALCDGRDVRIALPAGDARVAIACESASANVTVAGVTHPVDAPQRVDLAVAAGDLGLGGADADDAALLLSTRQ